VALIKICNASFSYGNGDVFSNISFSVKEGELFCLLGPNGCGKTTLLDCVLGSLKLQNGEILLDGRNTLKMRSAQLARYVSYVPQKHDRTFPYTVIDIVKMGRAAYVGMFGAPSREDERIAEEALDTVGISRLRYRPYTQISGGESQLVMIARALAQTTTVIVMDEPTAHLDFRHELVIMETVASLVRERKISVVMATHFPNHAFYFQNNDVPTRVALLHEGRFLAIGSPDEIICEKNMKQLYGVNAKLISYSANGQKTLKQIVPIGTVTH
jgi:iron complex transport system ATP-binding protein